MPKSSSDYIPFGKGVWIPNAEHDDSNVPDWTSKEPRPVIMPYILGVIAAVFLSITAAVALFHPLDYGKPDPVVVPFQVAGFTDDELFSIDQNVTAAMEAPAIYRTKHQYVDFEGSVVLVGVAGVGREQWPVEVRVGMDGTVWNWSVMEEMPKGFAE